MSFETIHTSSYSIRYVEGGPVETQADVWEAIHFAVDRAMTALELPGHLFVTVIGADTFGSNPDDPNDCGWALYHQGIQHIAVAGGNGPDELADDRAHWIEEIKVSTVHEVVHYWQELNGRLDGSERCENEAETKAREVLSL
ncbi:MAG: hypothetical protein AAF802_14790 [Planctomycetota bacterium]